MLGKLYLLPRTIADNSVGFAIPQEVLKITHDLNYIIAERAKTTRHYLKESGLNRSLQEITVFELDKHKPTEGIEEFLKVCLEGNNIGLMSEAGCPAVADPGALVVEKAHEMGIQVIPLVGPSSILLALMGSGFNGQEFKFNGYLPKDKGDFKKKIKYLESEANKGCTQLFIETPYRNQALLESLTKLLAPNTMLSIAVDIQGPSEDIQTFSISEWKKTGIKLPKAPAIFSLGKWNKF